MQVTLKLPKPHIHQQKVLDSKQRWKVLMCGRRFGKTRIAMIICIQRMLAGQHLAYITPEFGLGRDFFEELLQLIPSEIISKNNKTDLYIKLVTGGSLKFFSGEALGSMRGRKYHYIVIDEAAFIQDLEKEWNTSIRPTLSDYQGGCLFISTPRGKNFFYSLFLKGQNQEPDYESWQFESIDNPFFPYQEWLDAMSSIPKAQFNQEYRAIAGENQANPFGTDSINSNILPELSTQPTIVYGIDLAKYTDWTVITGLDASGKMSYFDRFQAPWLLTIQKIEALDAGGNILKAIDATGVGDVVVESLYGKVSNIVPFVLTTESKPKLIYELIKDVEQGQVQYNQVTADEMHVFEYTYTSTGHIKFAAQKGFNDDCVISLALANHFKNQAVANSNWTLYKA